MQRLFEQNTFNIEAKIKPNNKRAVKGSDLETVSKDIVDSMPSLVYSTKRPYIAYSFCTYNGDMYVSNQETSGVFNPAHWDAVIYTTSYTFTALGGAFVAGTNSFPITVSGLPTPYTAGMLSRVIVNLTHPDTYELDVLIVEPTASAGAYFTQTGVGTSGANFVNTELNRNSTALLTSSSAPYTGAFKDEQYPGFSFDSCVGYATNGDWKLFVENYGVTAGTVNSITLIFEV